MAEVDKVSARELVLFITNDEPLYRQQHTPINKNLTIKKAQGRYDHDKAAVLFGYLVESGAKKYAKEFGGTGSVWHEMFDKATRQAAAEELRDTFEDEYDSGQFTDFIPKKYQSKPVKATRRSMPSMTTFGSTRR